MKPHYFFLVVMCIACIVIAGCSSDEQVNDFNKSVVTTETTIENDSYAKTIEQSPQPTQTWESGRGSIEQNPYAMQGDKAHIVLKCMQGIGTVEDCRNVGVILDRDNGDVITNNYSESIEYIEGESKKEQIETGSIVAQEMSKLSYCDRKWVEATNTVLAQNDRLAITHICTESERTISKNIISDYKSLVSECGQPRSTPEMMKFYYKMNSTNTTTYCRG